MATINGLTAKNIRTIPRREKAAYHFSLWMDNKRIGYVWHDGSSGKPVIEFRFKEVRAEVEARANSYFEKFPSEHTTLDIFLEAVMEFDIVEKHYKKMVEKGLPFMIEFPSRDENGFYFRDRAVCAESMDVINKIIAEERPEKYTVYKDLSDFVIETRL